jgi:four helix bundle protein
MPAESFDHERMEVYRLSLEFILIVKRIIESLAVGQSDLADQLRRASTSISLNIAEGAGEFSKKEKARFYRMGKRSATECAAVLDIWRTLGLISNEEFSSGRSVLLRVVSMLIGLIKSLGVDGR